MIPQQAARSLNWREIDLVLEEIGLVGLHLREVHQPDPHTLILEVGGSGRGGRLLVRLAPPGVRLHLTQSTLRAAPTGGRPAGPPRFAALLRARVRGGHILEAAQVGRERVVRVAIRRGGVDLLLWLRLWTNAANAILTETDGRIVDVLYRRPARGEVAGRIYAPPPVSREDRSYTVRELEGEGSFNERLDRSVTTWERSEAQRQRVDTWLRLLRAHELRLETRAGALDDQLTEHGDYERHRQTADAILANLGRLTKGDRWLDLEDQRVELDPSLTPAENAQQYYARFKRSRATCARLGRDRDATARELRRVRELLDSHDPERSATSDTVDGADLGTAVRELGLERERPEAAPKEAKALPGLRFRSGPFVLLLGRSALESDELLRRHVRGSDLWFHCRDHPGAHVFVRSLPGKSVPLEVMLDAANLAVHHSKAKPSGAADVYYTAVKYLRRPRDGPPGLVLPTQEKNLHIRLDPDRIRRLEQG